MNNYELLETYFFSDRVRLYFVENMLKDKTGRKIIELTSERAFDETGVIKLSNDLTSKRIKSNLKSNINYVSLKDSLKGLDVSVSDIDGLVNSMRLEVKNDSYRALGDFSIDNYYNKEEAVFVAIQLLLNEVKIDIPLYVINKELDLKLSNDEYMVYKNYYLKNNNLTSNIEYMIGNWKLRESFPEKFMAISLNALFENKGEISYEPKYSWMGNFITDFETPNCFIEVTNWEKGRGYKSRLNKKSQLIKKHSSKNYFEIKFDFYKLTLEENFNILKSFLLKNEEDVNDVNFNLNIFSKYIVKDKILNKNINILDESFGHFKF